MRLTQSWTSADGVSEGFLPQRARSSQASEVQLSSVSWSTVKFLSQPYSSVSIFVALCFLFSGFYFNIFFFSGFLDIGRMKSAYKIIENRKTDGRTHGQTNIQTDRQTGTDRQTDRKQGTSKERTIYISGIPPLQPSKQDFSKKEKPTETIKLQESRHQQWNFSLQVGTTFFLYAFSDSFEALPQRKKEEREGGKGQNEKKSK